MISNDPKCRPILIYGAGIHLSGCEKEAIEYAERVNVPVVPTWGGLDIMPSAHPLHVGSFGTHGTRAGNFAVQNATNITAIGTRLDSKATGTPIESFARGATILMIDIDFREIEKFKGMKRLLGVPQDAKKFFQDNLIGGQVEVSQQWLDQIKQWKKKYPVVSPKYRKEDWINPYVFINELSKQTPEDTIICTDTGCAVAWVSQAWNWKKGQRFLHAFNQTPMGYGLPAAIGAFYATGKKIVLITGDGSLMMSIGELATVSTHKIPVSIFMFNNQGHAMCRQTEREWMGGKYYSTGKQDLSFPRFRSWAGSCENFIETWVLETPDHLLSREDRKMEEVIKDSLEKKSPTFVEVVIDPDQDVVPKVKYGHANEDGHPLIDLTQEMLIPLWTAS